MASEKRQSLNEEQAAHLIKMTLEERRSATSRPFAPGDSIGHYVLKKLLGKGAFGMVWQAEQLHPMKRDVALKILRPGLDIEESSDRFRIEGCALARMNHPGIAGVLDFGNLPGGEPYFAMELIRGGPITVYCEEKDLTLAERLQLMVQVCHAVQHAHQRAVLHRDLKPSNILVTEVDGLPVPKVIDFGIAKPMTDEVTGDLTLARTMRGMMLGTPRYMAPEQATLDGAAADVRADVYALGTILYELITGVTPVSDEDVSTTALPVLLKRICEDVPRRPSLLMRQLSPARVSGFTLRDLQELDWVVLKALEKQPDRRYASADALADDLVAFCDHQPLSVGPPGLGYRLHKLFQRHRAPVAAALVVLVCILISAFISINAYLDESAAHQAAERSSEESAANERRATAAVEFLSEMLQESGRQIGSGANATALRAALKRGEERLQEIESQPGLEATLCDQMAFTYEAMGDLTAAIRLRERSVALLAGLHGADAPEVLESQAKLAMAYANNGQQIRAAPLFGELARRWQSRVPVNTSKVFEMRRRQANALSAADRPAEGLAVMKSLLDVPDERGRPGRESLSFMRSLAEMQASTGDLAGARETLQGCLDKNHGKKSPGGDRARSMLLLSLARIEARENQPLLAARHYQESLTVGRNAGLTDHQSEIGILIEAARSYQSGRKFDEAMRCIDEAEAIARSADNRKELSHCFASRAQMCKSEGKLEQAVPAFLAFVANAGEENRCSTRLWLDINLELGECLMKLRRYDEGRQLAVMFWDSMKSDPRIKETPEEWGRVLDQMIALVSEWQREAKSPEMDVRIAEWRQRADELKGQGALKSAAR